MSASTTQSGSAITSGRGRRLAGWLPFASSQAEAAELLDVTTRLLDLRLDHLDDEERARLRGLFDENAA